MEVLSKRLKELRKEKNLTQRQIAEMLKIKQQSYVRYELGSAKFLKRTAIICLELMNEKLLIGK